MNKFNIANRACVAIIHFYQKSISPIKGKATCRFYPTCSQYAVICYRRFNFFKATLLTLWRIARCNPFCKGGIDYPPEKLEKR
ncbi:MAG: membrane protein insertion efficiency factor YidD [Bacillota bacterium]|nr:membrane protein insertion efficiency factor YidD [Bacillota bacterium]